MDTGGIKELLDHSVQDLKQDGWSDTEISRLLTMLYVRIQDDVQYSKRKAHTQQELGEIKRIS